MTDGDERSGDARLASEHSPPSDPEQPGETSFIEAVLPIVVTFILGLFVVWRHRKERTRQASVANPEAPEESVRHQ